MNPSSYSDHELLKLLKSHDRMAFNLIYSRYWEMSFQLAYKILHSAVIAEDVVQEVFTDIWLNRDSSVVTNLKSYVLQAVRFQTLKVIRHNKVISNYLERDFIMNFSTNIGADNLEMGDIKRILHNTVAQLPAKCREIFNLSRNQHMSAGQIAAILGLSPKTVDNQINIALKRIRKSMASSFVLIEVVVAFYANR